LLVWPAHRTGHTFSCGIGCDTIASGGPLTGTAASRTTVVHSGVTYTASQLVDILSGYDEGTATGGPPAG